MFFKINVRDAAEGNSINTIMPIISAIYEDDERHLVCGQSLDMEPGLYYGTNLVSYSVAVLISVVTFILWSIFIGFSLHDSRFFICMAFDCLLFVLLQPPLMRLSRTIWLAFFVPCNPNWHFKGDIVEPEKVNKDQMHNW